MAAPTARQLKAAHCTVRKIQRPMTVYHCTESSSHAPTDQQWIVGCRECLIEQYCNSTDFFRPKHIYEEDDESRPGISQFIMNPQSSVVTIETTGDSFVLNSAQDFITHWLSTGRCELLWNNRHQTPNILVREVGYGKTGSGTTAIGRFTREYTGVLIAKALAPDAHPYPVDPKVATADLQTWPWKCHCGAKAPVAQSVCLACAQSAQR